MTLPLPNLDNRSYADLVAEAISQIHDEYPEWTDHNPTDTGIILIELLAWLTEMTLYRVDQIPDENYVSFLSLLKGEQLKSSTKDITLSDRRKNLQSEIQNTLEELRQPYRAVSTSDYEKLVLEVWNKEEESKDLRIAKAKCFPQRNLQANKDSPAKGHISLLVVPENNHQDFDEKKYKPLFEFLDPRRLLTTIIHIVEPEYVYVTIKAKLVTKDGTLAKEVKKKAEYEIQNFFAPYNSGKYWQGKGWPFGKSVYLSELYKVLEDIDGVDYIPRLQITKDTTNNKYHITSAEKSKNQGSSTSTEISLKPNQLIQLEGSQFTIVEKIGNERKEY